MNLLVLLLALSFSSLTLVYGDHYSVLGIGRGASEDEIKRSFRKLSLRHHPDKHPNDPENFELYLQIVAAYEVLADPEARASYDRGGNEPEPEESPKAKPRTKSQDLWIDLSVAYHGSNLEVGIGRMVTCPKCHGSRRNNQHALGQSASAAMEHDHVAPGTDVAPDSAELHDWEKCPVCQGQGTVRQNNNYRVQTYPGTLDGSHFMVPGGGHQWPGLLPGDLRVVFRISPHDVYRRIGHDLQTVLEITPEEEENGIKRHIDHISGKQVLVKKNGPLRDGDQVYIKNKGMPILNVRKPKKPNRWGDLIVVLRTEVVNKATPEGAKANAFGDDCELFGDCEEEGTSDGDISENGSGEGVSNDSQGANVVDADSGKENVSGNGEDGVFDDINGANAVSGQENTSEDVSGEGVSEDVSGEEGMSDTANEAEAVGDVSGKERLSDASGDGVSENINGEAVSGEEVFDLHDDALSDDLSEEQGSDEVILESEDSEYNDLKIGKNCSCEGEVCSNNQNAECDFLEEMPLGSGDDTSEEERSYAGSPDSLLERNCDGDVKVGDSCGGDGLALCGKDFNAAAPFGHMDGMVRNADFFCPEECLVWSDIRITEWDKISIDQQDMLDQIEGEGGEQNLEGSVSSMWSRDECWQNVCAQERYGRRSSWKILVSSSILLRQTIM